MKRDNLTELPVDDPTQSALSVQATNGAANGGLRKRLVRADRVRDGTQPKVVPLPKAAVDKLFSAMKSLSDARGHRVFETDIMREALDDWFEAHGEPRHCLTQRWTPKPGEGEQ